jgi:plasmid maintenance system antidote protein VapI
MTVTLQELRQQKFRTVKAFAEVWGCSPSTGSNILNGRHHLVFTREEILRLAILFGVSFDKCVQAADETFRVSHNTTMASDDYWRLNNRWVREESIKNSYRQWSAKGGRDRILFAIESLDIFTPFGLSSDATKEDVLRAFRDKVKSMADGKGGYTGDMDALVKAKERALEFIQK